MTCKTVRENPVYTCKHCAWKVPNRPVHMTVPAWLNRSDLWAVCFSISIQTWILQRQVPTSVLSMHFRIIRLDRGCSPTLSSICLSHKNQTVAAEQDVVLQQKLMQAFAVFDKDGSGFISVNEDSDFRKQMTHSWLVWRPWSWFCGLKLPLSLARCLFVSDRTLGNNPFTDEQFETFLSESASKQSGRWKANIFAARHPLKEKRFRILLSLHVFLSIWRLRKMNVLLPKRFCVRVGPPYQYSKERIWVVRKNDWQVQGWSSFATSCRSGQDTWNHA